MVGHNLCAFRNGNTFLYLFGFEKCVVLICRSCFWLGLPATLNNLENIVYNKQSVIFVCLPSCPGKHPSSIFATKKYWNFLQKGIELQVIKQVIHYQFLSLIRSMATVGSGNLLGVGNYAFSGILVSIQF